MWPFNRYREKGILSDSPNALLDALIHKEEDMRRKQECYYKNMKTCLESLLQHDKILANLDPSMGDERVFWICSRESLLKSFNESQASYVKCSIELEPVYAELRKQQP